MGNEFIGWIYSQLGFGDLRVYFQFYLVFRKLVPQLEIREVSGLDDFIFLSMTLFI
jgi:hypothetical protein